MENNLAPEYKRQALRYWLEGIFSNIVPKCLSQVLMAFLQCFNHSEPLQTLMI